MSERDFSLLTRVERAALEIGRVVNENAPIKRIQQSYVRNVAQRWIKTTIHRRTYLDGVDRVLALRPDRGVILAANHRSFFDQYCAMLCLYECGFEFGNRIYFPVRSNFFYETPIGVFINYAVGGGVMYPPIFRDSNKSEFNKDALERLAKFLQTPGALVGVHPEGTRGKSDDPYALLPAQPGVGQIILQSKALVVPLFINGVTNNILSETVFNYRSGARNQRPLILCFGDPVDYSEYATKKPRAALYKRTSDKVLNAIRALSEREKQLRAACQRGEIPDTDSNWLHNR